MKSYDPDKVVITVGGYGITGFADGTYVNITRDSDDFSDVAGADGEVARAKSNDKRGAIVLTLMQTSKANAVLSGLAQSGAVVTVTIQDQNSEGGYASEQSWVLKPADAAFSKQIETREWTLRCAELVMFSDGSTDETAVNADQDPPTPYPQA